jgi:hypothetical protein
LLIAITIEAIRQMTRMTIEIVQLRGIGRSYWPQPTSTAGERRQVRVLA